MKEQIQQWIQESCPWQDSLIWYPQIDSTNTRAKALAQQGAPEGTVLIADYQTGGRGRMGRSFHSPAGSGVYMSVILRPECPPTEIMHLTCAAAVAVCAALERLTGLNMGIKWTNDLVYEKQKLGGILTELGLKADGTVDYGVVGVGINCCQSREDFPEEIRDMATSLTQITGRKVDRSRIAAAMVEEFYAMRRNLFAGKAGMLRKYRNRCVTLGQDISLRQGESVRYGRAVDVDDRGALVVKYPSGTVETVQSGEVSIRGMYGYV